MVSPENVHIWDIDIPQRPRRVQLGKAAIGGSHPCSTTQSATSPADLAFPRALCASFANFLA